MDCGFMVRRGIERMVADILAKAKQRRLAPTGLGARCSINYNLVDAMIKSDLLTVEPTRNGKITVLTEKGSKALQDYESYRSKLSDLYKLLQVQERWEQRKKEVDEPKC